MSLGGPGRGTIWSVAGQPESALGLLVVSNNTRNRRGHEVTGVPVLLGPSTDRPTVTIGERFVAFGELVRVPVAELEREIVIPSESHMVEVSEHLADLFLLPELLSQPPRLPEAGEAGDYPRWGQIYYAEPPLGGQTKRWLVVSHDLHNRTTGRVVCVRTTSNTSLESFEAPLIQRGFALAVCPDVQVKGQARFDLPSATDLEQASRDEMVLVARGLTNFLLLHRQTGVFD